MAYRDDDAALRTRKRAIEEELARVAERAAQLELLTGRRAELERELDDLERRRPRTVPLPLLPRVTIASPCAASWEHMAGTDTVRFCDHCEKHVYDLSAMTADEAERVLRAHEGDLCARLARRADGTVITGDCPVGARRKMRARTMVLMGVGVLSVAAGAYVARPAPDLGRIEDREVYGRFTAPPSRGAAETGDAHSYGGGVVAWPRDTDPRRRGRARGDGAPCDTEARSPAPPKPRGATR